MSAAPQAEATITGLDILGAASPILAALVAVGGVVGTIIVNNRRERDQQEHERLLKEAELDAARIARLREDRLRAYSTMARLTKTVDADNPTPGPAQAEAHSEIEMLTDNPEHPDSRESA